MYARNRDKDFFSTCGNIEQEIAYNKKYINNPVFYSIQHAKGYESQGGKSEYGPLGWIRSAEYMF